MRATVDFRRTGRGGPLVTLTVTMEEFREHVEWLEGMALTDGCTRDWRAELDRIDPAPVPSERER